MATYHVSHVLEKLSDADLLRRFQKEKDQLALMTLLYRYEHLVYAKAVQFKMDPEEMGLMSELYLQLYEKLPKQSTPISNFPAWLSRVVYHRLLDVLRRDTHRERYKAGQKEKKEAYHPRTEEKIDQSLLAQEALHVVNDREAACIKQRYFEDQSLKDVASALDLNFKQVCGRLERGMKKMRLHFGVI